MFYAHLANDEGLLKARFYSRQLRDEFCEATGARPVRSRAAKFVAGADRNVTFASRNADGAFLRV